MNKKKSVSDIIIDRFLKDVEEKGTMPWQRPSPIWRVYDQEPSISIQQISRVS